MLKKNGWPWEIGKVFPGSAVIGPWLGLASHSYLEKEFTLHIDGTRRQRGLGTDMGLKPVDTIKYIQEHFEVCEGDLIFTGTPEGPPLLCNSCILCVRDIKKLGSKQVIAMQGHTDATTAATSLCSTCACLLPCSGACTVQDVGPHGIFAGNNQAM